MTNYYVNVLRNPARYYTGRIQVFCANRSNSTVPVLSATSVSSLIPCYRQAAFPRNHVPRLWPARPNLGTCRDSRLVRWVPLLVPEEGYETPKYRACTGWMGHTVRTGRTGGKAGVPTWRWPRGHNLWLQQLREGSSGPKVGCTYCIRVDGRSTSSGVGVGARSLLSEGPQKSDTLHAV